MIKQNIRFRKEPIFGEYRLYIFQEDERSREVFVGKLTFEKLEQPASIEPVLILNERLTSKIPELTNPAQVLMDDLWESGIRPSEGQGSAGQLKAVQDHLSDMKKITFHQLKIKE